MAAVLTHIKLKKRFIEGTIDSFLLKNISVPVIYFLLRTTITWWQKTTVTWCHACCDTEISTFKNASCSLSKHNEVSCMTCRIRSELANIMIMTHLIARSLCGFRLICYRKQLTVVQFTLTFRILKLTCTMSKLLLFAFIWSGSS